MKVGSRDAPLRPLTSGATAGQDEGQLAFLENCCPNATDRCCNKKDQARRKSRRVFDERGLYLEISPGGGKWWRLKYRFAGKEKRLSLGVYPDVSLKDARDQRDEARRLVAGRVDPSENRKAAKLATADRQSNSFEVVTREWFSKHSQSWVEGHRSRVLRMFERTIFPYLGARPIAEITPPELLSVMRRIEASAPRHSA